MINIFKKLFSRNKETELKEYQHDRPVEVFMKEAVGTRRIQQDSLTAQNAVRMHQEALQSRRYTDKLPKVTQAPKTSPKASKPTATYQTPIEPCRAHDSSSSDLLTGMLIGAALESVFDSTSGSSSSSSDNSSSSSSDTSGGGGTFDGGGASGDW